MRRNLAQSLIEHETISTTIEKAKEVKPFVEKLITLAKKGKLEHRRRAISLLGNRDILDFEEGQSSKKGTVVGKLFSELGPRYLDRPGGYTRIIRLSLRRLGDNGELVLLQLLGEDEPLKKEKKASTKRRAKKKGKGKSTQLYLLLVLVLLSLPLSAWLWRTAGLDAYLDYPWQLLALTGLPLAFLAGSVTRLDERPASLPVWAGLLALVVAASYPYLAPQFTQLDPGPEPVALIEPVGAGAPQIMLLDYELLPPTEITPTLALTLTWQAVEPIADDYTVFVHLLTEDGSKAAQRDSKQGSGSNPI